MRPDQILLVNLSGRGDKDCNEIAEILRRQGREV
jgi:tryptophan synthase beta subunit